MLAVTPGFYRIALRTYRKVVESVLNAARWALIVAEARVHFAATRDNLSGFGLLLGAEIC